MFAQLDSIYLKTRPWKVWSRLIAYALFEGRPLTTRGRWINPIVFNLYRFACHIPATVQIHKPIFILGTGRSGTTVLGMVLSMHKHMGFLNEPKALWHAVHPGEDLIGSYTDMPARYRLHESDCTPHMIINAQRMYGAYLISSCSKRILDKYPELIFRIPFVMALFPDAKFLFLVRNGWDTCHSIRRWSESHRSSEGFSTYNWWGRNRRKWKLLVEQLVPEHSDLEPHASNMKEWTNETDMAAVEWLVTMREVLAWTKASSENMMRIYYEELCQSPRETLHKLLTFLDMPEDETFINYGVKTLSPVQPKQHIDLNPVIEIPFKQTMRDIGYDD